MRKLKIAVIKEELVELTGDYKKAIVLNQMIYWSERIDDKDNFIKEEIKRSKMAMGKDEFKKSQSLEEAHAHFLSHGWIYKSAEQLSEETLMKVSKSTMSRFLKELATKGWLGVRKNPNWKGDNTLQYRVNLVKIQSDLQALGFSLDGYSMIQNETPTFSDDTSQFQNETGSFKIEQVVSKRNRQFQNETTLPEITSQITSQITTDIKFSLTKDEANNYFSLLLKNGLTEREGKEIIKLFFEKQLKPTKSCIEFVARILKDKGSSIRSRVIYFVNGIEMNIDRKDFTSKPKAEGRKEIIPDWFNDSPSLEEIHSLADEALLNQKKKEMQEKLDAFRMN